MDRHSITNVAELTGDYNGELLGGVEIFQPVQIEEAHQMLQRYKEAKERGAYLDSRDNALVAISQAVVDGFHLLNIDEVLLANRVRRVPKLAFAPVTAHKVEFIDNDYIGGSSNRKLIFSAPGSKWGYSLDVPYASEYVKGKAVVPMVPITKRPDSVEDHFVLWEAEWEIERQPKPPKGDPLLLKLVHGNIYALIDWWDPSEAEIKAMTGALRLY